MHPIRHASDVSSHLYGRRPAPQPKKKRWFWQREKQVVQQQATKRVPVAAVEEAPPFALWHWLKVTSVTLVATCGALYGGYQGYNLAQEAGKEYPIKTVRVYGELKHIKPEHLNNQLVPALHENFFQLDLAQTREEIESMPWVHKAFLRKEWPDTLIVHVTERVPVAQWGEELLLGSDLSLFGRGEVSDLPVLPKLRGVEKDVPVVWSRYKKLNEMLAPLSLTVTELTMAERYSWRVLLSDGVELVVDENNWNSKITRFVQFYKKIPESDRALLARADLRYDNGLAVKWKKKDDHPDAA